jgi:hypothetical protein
MSTDDESDSLRNSYFYQDTCGSDYGDDDVLTLADELKRRLSDHDWETLRDLIALAPKGYLESHRENRGQDEREHIVTHCASGVRVPHGILVRPEEALLNMSGRHDQVFARYRDEEETMVKLALDLRHCMQSGDWERLQGMIDSIPAGACIPVLRSKFTGETLLHLGLSEFRDCPLGIVHALSKVMDMGDAVRPDLEGNTPLHSCFQKIPQPPLEMVALIAGAWPEAVLHENAFDMAPFDLALATRDPSATASILLNAYPDAVDHIFSDGGTILHRVLEPSENLDSIDLDDRCHLLVRLLLARKPELAHSVGINQLCPLHLMCNFGQANLSLLREILVHLSPEHLVSRDDFGWNALHYAMNTHISHLGDSAFSNGNFLGIVRELLGVSFNLIHDRNLEGKTPMDNLATFIGNRRTTINFDRVQTFLQNTVFAHGPHCHSTRAGELVLHSALYTKDFPFPITEKLIAASPERVKEVDETGNLPLHLAAQIECIRGDATLAYVDVIDRLIEAFPEAVQIPNPDGKLPLHLMITARRTWNSGIQKLIEAHPLALCILNLKGDALFTLLSRLNHDTMYRLLQDGPTMVINQSVSNRSGYCSPIDPSCSRSNKRQRLISMAARHTSNTHTDEAMQ